jgi:nicotinamide mononucleotide transporter
MTSQILPEILKALHDMTLTEIMGTITGLVCVALTVRAHVLCWPIGIVSCIAFAKLFFDIKLYADAILQVFFITTSVWGWWGWHKGGNQQTELPISRLTRAESAKTMVITGTSILAIGWMFRSYTDAHLPFWDSTISGLSVAAQILLVRKKIENWILWIVVDVLSIGVYFYKQVYLTSALYAVFLVLATQGLFEWKKRIDCQQSQSLSDSNPVSATASS